MNNVDIAGVLARLRRDYPKWHVTHHATAAAPGGVFLARRPVPTDDGPDAFAAAAADEQELRRRLDIQESLAQRLTNLSLSRGSPAPGEEAEVAAVIADLQQTHPDWHIAYEITCRGATFTAWRALPPGYTGLGLSEAVTAPSARELSWRLASQDAQLVAVSMAEGPQRDPAERLTETVAGFEDLLRRTAGET
ncbi:hypothetical protein ACFQZ2_00045 [Streptomonospora algeriensis]|uniref:Uncharacterized protein n=1 Tax=Streptomonospora algeriensis TaxID=995084 RepID=A0ABW3BAI0_9ACTN